VVLVALAALGCGAGPTDTTSPPPGSPPSNTAPPGCAVADPGFGSDGRRTITVDGTERSYLVRVPAGREPGARSPLILALHGFGGSADELEDTTHLGADGSARGALVVIPDAATAPARWNFDRRPGQPDDFAIVDTLVADLIERACVDPARVSVAGSSNGAAFAGLLACTDPYRFAAVAMVIATVPSGCPDTVTPSVLTIRGTADTHVRYDGTPELVATIAERAGCDASPTREPVATDVERTRYTGCRNGAVVVLDSVIDGPHAWPGSRGTDPAGGYGATATILDFLDQTVAR
jgi:polyhydroxybutyrate depolymerase